MKHAIYKRICLATTLVALWCTTLAPSIATAETQPLNRYPVQACAGRDLVRVLDNQGVLWAWGGSTGNGAGQMGFGDDAELGLLAGYGGSGGAWHFSAQPVAKGFRSIACSNTRTAAIGVDGALWFWGQALAEKKNLYSDAAPNVYRPKRVGSGYVSVVLGEQHVLAVRADGSLWAWGQNDYGQLGDGSTTFRDQAVKVGDSFARVVAGRLHSAGIKRDGSLWVWGNNERGQMGQGAPATNGVPTHYLTPVQVPGVYVSVGVGDYYTAAVLVNGDLMAWGQSRHGFGRGVEEDTSPTPQRIGTGFTKVVVGESHSLAMKPNGDVWEWGWRTNGPRNLSPVQVGESFASIDVGDYESAAIKRDHTLWLWGGSNWARLAEVGYADGGDVHGPKNWIDPTLAAVWGSRAAR